MATTKKRTGKQAKKTPVSAPVVTDRDRIKVTQVMVAAAYRASEGLTACEANMKAFGPGVPFTINTLVSMDAQGRASVKHVVNVEGRTFAIEA